MVSARGCPGSTCISPVWLERCKLSLSPSLSLSSARAMPTTSSEPVHMFCSSLGLSRIPPTTYGKELGLRVALNPTAAPDRPDAGPAMLVTVAHSCTGQDRPGRLRNQRWALRSVQHKNCQTWNEYYPEESNCPIVLPKVVLLCIAQTRAGAVRHVPGPVHRAHRPLVAPATRPTLWI